MLLGEQDHLDQASHNERFLGHIDRSRYGDWAATVAFYVALQYIDAFLARKGIHDPRNHDNRENFARSYSELKRILTPYGKLKSASIRARYYGEKPPVRELSTLIDSQMRDIKRFISRLLAKKPRNS